MANPMWIPHVMQPCIALLKDSINSTEIKDYSNKTKQSLLKIEVGS